MCELRGQGGVGGATAVIRVSVVLSRFHCELSCFRDRSGVLFVLNDSHFSCIYPFKAVCIQLFDDTKNMSMCFTYSFMSSH